MSLFSSISSFVQQLLAAELFLAVGFVSLLAFVGVCYVLVRRANEVGA